MRPGGAQPSFHSSGRGADTPQGLARTVGRWSDHLLRSEAHVTFEDDTGACDQKATAGVSTLKALRRRLVAMRNRRLG